MRIGVDGTALNQGILAGIYNVTVQLLNEMAKLRPKNEYTVFLPSLDFDHSSEIFSTPNVHAHATHFLDRPYSRPLAQCLPISDDAAPYLLIDDVHAILPISRSSRSLTFLVERPCRSITLVSRSIRPSDLSSASSDTRNLGLAISAIQIRGQLRTVIADHRDPRLGLGFHSAEPAHRWTNGMAVIPRSMFVSCGFPMSITITLEHMLKSYFTVDETTVASAREFYRSFDNLVLQVEDSFARRAIRSMDVYHSHHFAPRIIPGVINIATAHDIVPILHPEYFGADAVAHFKVFTDVLRRCDRVFCVSEATRCDLITVLDFSPEKVITAPNDCNPAFHQLMDAEIANPTLQRYGLSGRPYIICVGTIEPRKGHARIVEAYSKFRADCPNVRPRLAIIGKRGWHFEKVFSAIDTSEVNEDIIYIDYVPLEDLVHLYNRAHFAAYLSSYEGFGLPILEALACGVPVVASNTSSMPEVAGRAGLLVRPDDVGQIADAFRRMFVEPDLRDMLASEAPPQRAQFSWRRSAQIYIDHIENMVKETRVSE